jgi:hypothetical protein
MFAATAKGDGHDSRGSDSMARWASDVEKLPRNHGLDCKPGYKIFIGNRGAIRFDFPEHWIVIPGPDSVCFHDKQPPDDNWIFQASILYLPPQIDWSGLPLQTLLLQSDEGDKRAILARGEIQTAHRKGIEIVWRDSRFMDDTEKREAISRMGLARSGNVQALLTFDFWPEHKREIEPAWREILRTLRLDEVYKDPSERYLH